MTKWSWRRIAGYWERLTTKRRKELSEIDALNKRRNSAVNTRQTLRRFAFEDSMLYINRTVGGELRSIRRSMARDRFHRLWKEQRAA